MYRRRFYLFVFLTALLLLPARDARSQMCIGTTTYIVRDETGKIMSPERMKKLTIKNLSGIALPLRTDPGNNEPPYYEYEHFVHYLNKLQSERLVTLTNPLTFQEIPDLTMCGKLGDLTLVYGGKEMRLLFDIREHNSYFEIDSLPFQEGTFHLRGLNCKDGASPPLIDNNTTGKCLVSADNWEGMDKAWVRHLVIAQKSFGGGYLNKPADFCRSKPMEVITTQADWAAVWKAYPEVTSNRLPDVDFRYEFVLLVYLAGRSASYTYDSIIVDKKGNLTFDPGPYGFTDPKNCSLLILILYRSGIKSVEGKPLPPAPAR